MRDIVRGLKFGRMCLSIGVALCFLLAFFVRCASINSTLTGGPKDTLPPVIISMLPDNYSTEFPQLGNNRRIYIEFDEFVQIKDQQKEFFTSPQMKKKPTLTVRGRGILITIKDTLDSNRTYALNFGSALRDNNEGNPLNGMRYVFSTGKEVDSMVCSGYTADSYKADSVSKSFIWFFIKDSVEYHEEYDSTLFKYKPHVIARAENNGIFLAQNLKPIDYWAYAIEDTNDNQLYEAAVDQVGFLHKPVNPAELPDFAMWYDSARRYVVCDPQLYFRMFTDVTFKRQRLADHQRPSQHQAMLYFAAAKPEILSFKLDSIPEDKVIWDRQTVGHDTVALWFNMPAVEIPDTIRGEMIYLKHDSIDRLVPDTAKLKFSWKYVESKEEQKERERIEREREKALAAGQEYEEPKKENPFKVKMSLSGEVNPENSIEMEFDYPLIEFDSTAVDLSLERDDKSLERVKVHFRRDTLNMRKWYMDVPWTHTSKYKLHIPAGTFTDVAGFKNDSIGGTYNTSEPEKYAIIKIKLTPKAERGKYIVQMLNTGGQVQQQKLDVDGGEVVFNYIKPGDVQFRIIEDMNGNGKWDTGNVVERREPERSEIYVDPEGNSTFTTKANWEIEVEMDMNDMFAPVTMQSLIELLDKRELQRLQKEAEAKAKADAEARVKGTGDSSNGSSGGFGLGGAMGGLGGAMGGKRTVSGF